MTSTLNTVIGVLGALFVLSKYVSGRDRRKKLAAFPTFGKGGPFAFITDRIAYLQYAIDIFNEGYEKYNGQLFKVRTMTGWVVVLSSPRHLDDMRKAPDDVLSALDAQAELIEMDYTMGPKTHHDPYQVDIVKGPLTKSIQARFLDVRDEIVASFKDLLPPTEEWTSIKLNPTMQQIICRASNRFFIGKPLCRNPDWVDLNVQFTVKVFVAGAIIHQFPNSLKPLVSYFVSPRAEGLRRAKKHLAPLIQERMAQYEAYGNDWEKPADMFTWLLDAAYGVKERMDLGDMIMRILGVNFAAIHTTSMTFTAALNYLCIYPEYVAPLREEVEEITNEHGWSKLAMGRMRKLDSFLKETQRHGPFITVGVDRIVKKDFVLSDGSVIPAGVNVGMPVHAIHHDETFYDEPEKFKGFRFADMRDGDGESTKHQMVTPGSNYILFGYGRHACPGRFFAVNELKALVAHVLLNYDVKVEKEGGATMQYTGRMDNNVKFSFRKRRV